MKFRTLLIAGVFALPALVVAQETQSTGSGSTSTTQPTANPVSQVGRGDHQKMHKGERHSRKEHGDNPKIQELKAKHRDEMKDLHSKKQAAVAAVRGDKTLTRDQKKAKISDIRKDFDAQRNTSREKFRQDIRTLREEMHKDRKPGAPESSQTH